MPTLGKPGWVDCDVLLMHAVFQVVAEFVDGELSGEPEACEGERRHAHQMELIDHLGWWRTVCLEQDLLNDVLREDISRRLKRVIDLMDAMWV